MISRECKPHYCATGGTIRTLAVSDESQGGCDGDQYEGFCGLLRADEIETDVWVEAEMTLREVGNPAQDDR